MFTRTLQRLVRLAFPSGFTLQPRRLGALLRAHPPPDEAEPGEERQAAHARILNLLLQRALLRRQPARHRPRLPRPAHQVQQAARQIAVLLPADGHGLADEPRPAVARPPVPEPLLQHGILEVLVGREGEADRDAARVAAGRRDLEVADGEVDEGGEEERRVGWLDVLIDVWGSLLEDERPEVGDLGGGLVASVVEGLSEGDLLTDCEE